MTHLIELDGRRRTSLGRVGRKEHTLYLADEAPDGTITLTPAVVLSEAEARLHGNPDLIARFEANRRDPTRLVRRRTHTTASNGAVADDSA